MAALPWTQSPWSTGGNPTAGLVPSRASSYFGGKSPTAPGPGTPEYAAGQTAGANSAGAAANTAGNTAAANHNAWVTGQTAGAMSAGAAANAAGNNQVNSVLPAAYGRPAGGSPSATPTPAEAEAARQKAANAAGLDFMQPGINERFMQTHGNDLLTGGPSDAFWQGYGTDLMDGSNSQKVFDDAWANRPGLPNEDLDTYYNRAEQNATTKLSAAQAARGAYGSSVGVGLVGSMLADLGAQRAKDKADYGLKRSDLERNWMTARGDLASAADRDAVSRWTATGSGAATADDQVVNRWRTTQQGAESAQGSQRQRGQDLFTNNLNMGNALSGVAGNSFETGAVQDQGIMDAIIKLGLAKDAAGVADLMRRANEDQAVAKQVMDAISAYATSQAGKKEGS